MFEHSLIFGVIFSALAGAVSGGDVPVQLY
jgi:hypothetical protein